MSDSRVAVIGAGSWGTALGATLAGKGYPVTLWDADVAVLDDIVSGHRNARYLPGIELPPSLTASADLATALDGARLVVMAVPSHAVRGAAVAVAPQSAPPTKKSKADDKIAPSPYTEPKAP